MIASIALSIALCIAHYHHRNEISVVAAMPQKRWLPLPHHVFGTGASENLRAKKVVKI